MRSPLVHPLPKIMSVLDLIMLIKNIRKEIKKKISFNYHEKYTLNITTELPGVPLVSFVGKYCICMMNELAKSMVNDAT